MNSKLKYILSTFMVVALTFLMIMVPDMAFLKAGAKSEQVYECEATPIFSGLEPSQVAQVCAFGEYINRYDYFESDSNEIRRLSLQAVEKFFEADEKLLEEVRRSIIGEDILFQQVHCVAAVVDDRMVGMELVSVEYLSGVSITFEKNTLTVLYLTFELSDKDDGDTQKGIGLCIYKYQSEYIKNPEIMYEFYVWDEGKAIRVCEIAIAPYSLKESTYIYG